jgi:LuxR family maltose regulon positive regulatory protein
MDAQKAGPRTEKTKSAILGTKLFIPRPRPQTVLRKRLIDCLDTGFEQRLTLVSAPAGFGKTTLVSHWIHHRKIPAAWFSIDASDDDPILFLKYIIFALQSLDPEIGRAALSIIDSPQPPQIEGIVINLLNELLEFPRDFILVLDDYHLIEAGPVHELLSFILANCPPPMHLIIVTRADPNLPLARLRSQRQLADIRAQDLMFTAEETAQFFQRMLDLDLVLEDVSLLDSRIEGWVAGLQLVALLIQDRSDVKTFIRTFKSGHRYIGDYLIEEVLNRQSEEIQDFLLKTSVLDRLSGPLCDSVTGRSNSRNLLHTLEKNNLFIFPLDDRREWFRYHQLFADLLRQRLRQSQPAIVSDLHLRASEWLSQNRQEEVAVEHAIAAEDFELAARLIEETGEIIWDHALQSRQLEWFKRFPEDQLEAWPHLGIYYTAALLGSGSIQEAEERLNKTEGILDELKTKDRLIRPDGTCMEIEPLRKQLDGRIATIRALMATFAGDTARIDSYANLALKTLAPEDLMWRGMAAITLAMAHGWAGDGRLSMSQTAFEEAAETSRKAGNDYMHIFSRLGKASILGLMGRPREAAAEFRKLLELAAEKGLAQTSLAGSIHASLGGILNEWDRVEEGLREIEEGIRLTQENRDWIFLFAARLNKAHALFRTGDIPGLKSELKTIDVLGEKHHIPPWMQHVRSGLKAIEWLLSGDLGAAAAWLAQQGIGPESRLSYRTEYEHTILVTILTRQARFQEAQKLLERLIEQAEAGNRVMSLLQLRRQSAVNYFLQGNEDAALAEMAKLLSMAEPGGYIRLFVYGGEPVAALLKAALNSVTTGRTPPESPSFSRAFVEKLLAAFQARPVPKKPLPWEVLSRREHEVLKLIADGFSNQQIADRLFISLNTVRTHTKNINGKLGVHNRTKAVAAAKAKGILSP